MIKPSEQTPLTLLKLAKIIAGIFPAGVVNVVTGRGASVGNALIHHPKVAMVSLTGDIGTGKKVCRPRPIVKRTHLELGGKAPVIVFDDDLASVVEGVKVYGYYNAGRTAPPPAASMPAGRSMTSLLPTFRTRSSASSSISPTMTTMTWGR